MVVSAVHPSNNGIGFGLSSDVFNSAKIAGSKLRRQLTHLAYDSIIGFMSRRLPPLTSPSILSDNSSSRVTSTLSCGTFSMANSDTPDPRLQCNWMRVGPRRGFCSTD